MDFGNNIFSIMFFGKVSKILDCRCIVFLSNTSQHKREFLSGISIDLI